MSDLQILSNGSYHIMATASSHGYSRLGDVAITRWQADATLDNDGTRCHVREYFSPADHPTAAPLAQPNSSQNEVCAHDFRQGRASFLQRTQRFETHTELAVSHDDSVELRRVVITNLCKVPLSVSATSYAEIVLSPPATDSAHLAFSKLFVQTEIDPALQAIFATRRPSTPSDATLWFCHFAMVTGAMAAVPSFETDRMRFIGRGRSASDPQALDAGGTLSGTAGSVLDAVAAIRVPLSLEAGQSITADWFTGVAPSREACVALVKKYREAGAAAHVLLQATDFRQSVLSKLAITDADAMSYQRMVAPLVNATAELRADAKVIESNRRGQSGLWGFAISGDLPITLLQLSSAASSVVLQQAVQAHAFWQAFGLQTELAVLCEPAFVEQVRQQLATGPAAALVGRPGGIFVLDNAALDEGDRSLLHSVARMVLTDAESLAAQLEHRLVDDPAATSTIKDTSHALTTQPVEASGLGVYSTDGREYVISTSAAQMTPAPWVNVIANPEFGTLVCESGSATTWSENAHEFRLTPWSNDPVSDPNTEAFYIRDEASGRFWSPTVLPTRSAGAYTVRHGFGYSAFEHTEDDIDSELRLYVAIDSPVKFSKLTLHNRSDRPRSLSVTGYVEWVLGDERNKTRMQVVTTIDPQTGALFARNGYNTDFAERTVFFDADNALADVCGDRADFLGPNGSLAAPAAMAQATLSGRVGAALDPCAALRVKLELAPGETKAVVFRLGAGKTANEARALVSRWREPGAAEAALDAVHTFWRQTLGAVQVHTPDAALNTLANGWLLYQVIASRLWGRTAFYQSSGAFGFRDQLQDVMSLVHAAPDLVREHLLRAASRQFVEGDVQHWWHPPSGKGVRTRCADDFLWLPLVLCRYVEVTGDTGVLDAHCPFLDSRALKDGEASNYELPKVSEEVAALYEHAARAVRRAFVFGPHGLPLMGGGDWNDGMNLVGIGGQGESVWMAFFLITVLKRFAPLARSRGDTDLAARCDQEASCLSGCVEASAWDGAWYRRAWFDDGAVLGSAANTECQIDSIAQSWSVLSGAAPRDHAERAMASVDEKLVHRDTQLVQLLNPPFDISKPSPGYIQGYLPGVRENGGQYTHAAMWAAMAFAALGDADRAWDLCAMLMPQHHATDAAAVATYQVEPYVVAGDVYAFSPHAGRGGWTWYTGSAGWMQQLIVESLLGLRKIGDQLHVRPLFPRSWKRFDVSYRYGASTYAITCCEAAAGVSASTVVDGISIPGDTLTLIDDCRTHVVCVNVSHTA